MSCVRADRDREGNKQTKTQWEMCFQERWETSLVIQTEEKDFSTVLAWEETQKTKGKGKEKEILRKIL